ncbi:MAG TPA: protein kinase [Blastocatellia bacterium]|nr:protein kinase [Blastocatellia bacterium]
MRETMTPERWQQVDHLLEAMLDLDRANRARFLDSACAGDEALRREVESLLFAHDSAEGFIEELPPEQVAELLTGSPAGLARGEALGHYKIIEMLGAGGMGEVYLAEDTRLGRKVALKVLPENLGTHEQAKRRFAQEAKTASALNHSHIITIYDIVADGSREYIVMEYVEGETLRETLTRGKVGVKRALEIAAQAASGLAAAHAAGIVHRDVKPENLMVTPSAQVKVLDFGLAKLTEQERGPLIDWEASTVPFAATAKDETAPGTILGTVAYMSPEQAQGHSLDHRTDIFSLGVVLYEMLSGARPFTDKSPIDTLHAIINREPPPIVELNSRVPAEAVDVLGKALAKNAAERYQHAGDFEIDLRRLKRGIETNSLPSTQTQMLESPRRLASTRVLLALAAVTLLVIAAIAFAAWRLGISSVSAPRATALANIKLTPLTSDSGYEGEPTFSPDGETIAYVSDRSGNLEIYLKQISGGADINLTNNPTDDVQPAFSTDGKQIAFVSTRSSSSGILYYGYDLPLMGGDIWVMPALGGGARRIAESGNFPSWSPDASALIYTSGPQRSQKLYRVASSGGEAKEIPLNFKAEEPPRRFLLYPSYSSDGRWILFEADVTTYNVVYIVSAEGGEPKQIAKGKRPVWGADSQMVIYSSAESGKNYALWQVPFSTSTGEVSGSFEPLTVGRGRDTQAAASRDGRLIAFTALTLSFNLELQPFDPETGRQIGAPTPITEGNDLIYFGNFSPDGLSVVFESHRGASSHIWRTDLGSPPTQLTSDPKFDDFYPRWSPDGRTIAFCRKPAKEPRANNSLWLMTSDGANPRLLVEKVGTFSFTWMPDGGALIYFSPVDSQLYLFDLKTGGARRLTDELHVSFIPVVSPDGKWLIYQSTLAGNIDLRAMPLDGGQSQTVVSTPHQDFHPFVSPSGKWLYFQLDHKNLYRVPGPAQGWRPSAPEKITNYPESNLYLEDPQLSRDGRRLLYSRGRVTGDIWIMEIGN